VSSSPLHVIVLDDRSRFALHVWRYLSRSVGFGIGDIQRDGELRDRDDKPVACPWRLETPAGDAVVWWISVRNRRLPKDWKAELDQALAEATESERRLFLVDVRGEPGAQEEFWLLAFEALRERSIPRDPKYVWLVSSYGVGIVHPKAAGGSEPPPFHVRPKNTETLQRLAERIWPLRDKKATGKRDPETFHVLVSGAGFELKLKSEDNPQITKISPLGVPTTHDLLERAYRDKKIWGWGDADILPGDDKTLPLPPIAQSPNYEKSCLGGARMGLDDLWDALVETVLEAEKGKTQTDSRKQKAAMLNAERSARESFRSAFFGDDWGELSQALDAAALPWQVWLTTNYTQFVDRAVALLQSGTNADDKSPRWRVLSIASEAEHLLRRLFFEDGLKNRDSEERLLFKLHGDLGHLTTMAVAGQDKELFSLTTQTVDHFYWLYDAARDWIEELLKEEKVARVYWHIVGHGLGDQVLVQTLRQVRVSTPRVQHSFLIVRPKVKRESFFLSLSRQYPKIRTWDWDWKFYPYQADQWMAMLRKFWENEGRMWTPPKDNDGDLPGDIRKFIQ
jgi:hypothetical protein